MRLADALRRWRGRIAFPGRLRVFADRGRASAMAELAPAGLDWTGAPDEMLLAAACGAAWAERERGGVVTVVAGPGLLDGGCAHEALALAARLGLTNLHWIGADDRTAAIAAAHGWRRAADDDAAWFAGDAPAVATLPLDSAASASAGVSGSPRREWQPVHLAALAEAAGASVRGDPTAAARTWLADLARREPRLLLPHAAQPWREAPDTIAKLVACAQLAGDGWRVAWMPRPGACGPAWLGALAEIGRRGLALKLLLPAGDCPSLTHWQALPEWWLASPLDAAGAVEIAAAALDNEDCTVVMLPDAAVALSGAPFEWGAGRWSRAERAPAAVVVFDARGAAAAVAAREALRAADRDCDLLHCASLAPLPLAQLAEAANRAALVVVDGEPVQGLSRAIAAALAGQEHLRLTALVGEAGPPSAAEVAQAVRAIAGR